MVGELIVTICDKGEEGTHKAVELWAYPDGTLNLILVSQTDKLILEHAFPCTVTQLFGVLEGKPLHSEVGDSLFLLRRNGDQVCVAVEGPVSQWRHCIHVLTYSEALDDAILMRPALV